MEQKTISLKELKQRKMLFILPVLLLPSITLLFWSLGGGKMKSAVAESEEQKGFNIELPEPKFKADADLDKMSYYDKATLDSIKREEQIREDPNYAKELFASDSGNIGYDTLTKQNSFRRNRSALNINSFKNPNEEKVYQKLEALQRAISQPPNSITDEHDMSEFESRHPSVAESEDVKSLEQMMSAMNQPQEPDPELKQLGGMLENILDIQHPSRMEEKLKQSSLNQKGKVFTVDKKRNEDNITSLRTSLQISEESLDNSLKQNAFYSLQDDSVANEKQNALDAVIHETRTIVDGSTVKFRFSSDIFIEGVSIPKNSFLFGTASLKDECLIVKINSIKHKNSLFPVELSVYDMDGIAGIYIPGAINRDVAKSSADRSIQTLGVASLNDSWGSQVAGAGIEAAKSLLSKKVKLIKVVVKAGYQVLLYDEKQRNSK